MDNKQKILKLLQNDLLSNYAISQLSGEQLATSSIRRYRKGLNPNGGSPKTQTTDISKVKPKTEEMLVKVADEVERAKPQSKEDVKKLIQDLNQSGKLW